MLPTDPHNNPSGNEVLLTHFTAKETETCRSSVTLQRSCNLEGGELRFETRLSGSNTEQCFRLLNSFSFHGLCELDESRTLFTLRFPPLCIGNGW